jgi:hypothetical protein
MLTAAMLTNAMLTTAMLTTAMLTTAMLTTTMLTTAMLTTAILTTAMLTTAKLTTTVQTTTMLITAMLTTAMLTTRMPDCPASSQSSTRLRKTNDAGTDPVPELNDAVWRQGFGEWLFPLQSPFSTAGLPAALEVAVTGGSTEESSTLILL